MKNQAQIERKNSTSAEVRQRHRRATITLSNVVAGLTKGSREIYISELCLTELNVLAARIKADRLVIAAAAIRNYLDFVELHPDLAEGQPMFRDCDELLGCFDPKQPLLVRLDRVCGEHGLLPSQLITNAVDTYLIFARLQTGKLAQWMEHNPGEIDPEQIAYLLSMQNQPESTFYDETVSGFANLPFQTAIQKARGLLGLIAPHPGFAKERVALEMMVEGADRLI